MSKSNLLYINPYSNIVGKNVKKLSKEYGVTFSAIQSKYVARINLSDYIIYGDESITVEGPEKNVALFTHNATKPKEKNLEKIID